MFFTFSKASGCSELKNHSTPERRSSHNGLANVDRFGKNLHKKFDIRGSLFKSVISFQNVTLIFSESILRFQQYSSHPKNKDIIKMIEHPFQTFEILIDSLLEPLRSKKISEGKPTELESSNGVKNVVKAIHSSQGNLPKAIIGILLRARFNNKNFLINIVIEYQMPSICIQKHFSLNREGHFPLNEKSS